MKGITPFTYVLAKFANVLALLSVYALSAKEDGLKLGKLFRYS